MRSVGVQQLLLQRGLRRFAGGQPEREWQGRRPRTLHFSLV